MTEDNRFEKVRTIVTADGSPDNGGAHPSSSSDPDATEGPPSPSVTTVPTTGVVPSSASGTTSPASVVLNRVEVYFQVYPGKTTINGTPIGIANQPYTVQVGTAAPIAGTSDANGKIEITFSPGATIKLTILGTEYNITNKTTLEPVAQLAGVQRRLAMLGYELGSHNVDGSIGKYTAIAIHSFQCDADINLHGRPRSQLKTTLTSSTWVGE